MYRITPMSSGSSDRQGLPETATTLVTLLRAGDPQAGSLLTELYRTPLLRFCWGYLSNLEEAEDAVQEICMKVVRANNIPDAFRPWLYKIARNHCFNQLRTKGRRRDLQGGAIDTQLSEALTGQLTRLANDEIREKLRQLVQSLPETQREVLRLRYVEGLHRAEIAEVLDVPESVIKSRLFESLKRLRDQSGFLTQM